MITISKNELAKRWDNLSQPLREALWSEYNSDVLWDICKKEHLSEEKTAIVAMLAGDIIMGFLLAEDFGKEVAENVGINREIADRIAVEVEKKIFRPVMNEIKEIYSPPTEKAITDPVIKIKDEGAQQERTVPLETIGRKEPITADVKIEPKAEKMSTPPETEIKPFVIHQEERQEPVADDKKFKGLDFPFGFFGKEERDSGSSEPIRVTIEAPGEPEVKPLTPFNRGGILKGFGGKKDDKERVVHYSEYRTPLTPFGKPEEEIISLQNFTKREAPPANTKPEADTPQPLKKGEVAGSEVKISTGKTESRPGTPAKNKPAGAPPKGPKGPSIEGNIIDLKNL